MQIRQEDVAPQRAFVANFDPADLEQPVNLARGEILGRFVGGNAVFVQSARLGPRVKDHDVMPMHGKTMRTGQTCRTGPDNGNAFAGRSRPGERMHPLRHQCVGGVTLKPADLDRFTLGDFPHTDFFAQGFGGTHAGAHATHDVLAQNRLGRGFGRSRRDLANEERNVDIGRACGDARRVVAEIAAVGGH